MDLFISYIQILDPKDHLDQLDLLHILGLLKPHTPFVLLRFLDSIHDSGSKTRVAILTGKASPPSSRLFCRAVGTCGGVNTIPTRGQIMAIILLFTPYPSGFEDLPMALNLERVDCRHCIDGF